MTRNKYEFPTEWAICPDASPDERNQQQVVETKTQEQEAPAAEPRAFAAGGFASLPR